MTHYNLPTSMEMLLSIAELLPQYSQVHCQKHLLPCVGCTSYHNSYLIMQNNSLFNSLMYADFQIVLLHCHKHEGNHATGE